MSASAEDRRERVVAAAREAFIVNGYSGTSIGDIAAALNLSKAAVYYYFPQKADFLIELVHPLLDSLDAVLARHPTPSWPDGELELLGDYFATMIDHIEVARWVDTDPTLRIDDGPGTRLRALDRTLATKVAGGSRRQADQMRALAVVGGLWRPLHHEDADRLRRHADEIVRAALVSYNKLS